MNFVKNANTNMTHLVGNLRATYADLVEVFGQPDERSGDKITCSWHLKFEDGTVATIYDWKEDETPLGDYDWHIGGRTPRAFDRVYDTFFNVSCN